MNAGKKLEGQMPDASSGRNRETAPGEGAYSAWTRSKLIRVDPTTLGKPRSSPKQPAPSRPVKPGQCRSGEYRRETHQDAPRQDATRVEDHGVWAYSLQRPFLRNEAKSKKIKHRICSRLWNSKTCNSAKRSQMLGGAMSRHRGCPQMA